ncbi:ankyrin-3-like isoform X1 [Onthophagus taurus]|uniref:ankyrin-3-like isoform X1 n=2 Tax=Onthophagus taurus TaxID=166361 RepID=UPI0039BDAA68
MMARSTQNGAVGIGQSESPSRWQSTSFDAQFQGGGQRDLDDRKLVQEQFMLMLHNHICQNREFEGANDVELCPIVVSHCEKMKTLLDHMVSCLLQKCPIPHCTSAKQILKHWKHCVQTDCPACFPLTQMNRSRNNPFHEETSLHLAAIDSILQWGQLLIINGTYVNAKNKCQQTPLHLGTINNNFEFSKMLIENGADVNDKDNREETPLHIAIANNNLKFSRMLLENGADVNAKTYLSETPLHLIATTENIEMMRLMVENGADVNALNYNEETPLHLSCNNIKLSRFLIENGADVNAKDGDGKTPLHHIVSEYGRNFNNEFICMMLYYNASVNEIDKSGEFPFMIAVKYWNYKIADILFDYVDELNYKSVFISTLSTIFVNDLINSVPERVFEYIDKIKIEEASDEIIDEDINCAELLYTSIYTCFSQSAESLKWVWLLLSKGFPVTLKDIEIFHNEKGFCNEIEAILSSEVPIGYEYGCQPFIKTLIFNKRNNDEGIINNRYFSEDGCVPSLKQIARDCYRKTIFDEHQRENGVNYKAFNVIMRMNIPKVIKDILLLRRPIYIIN